jgi:hypothetical protein
MSEILTICKCELLTAALDTSYLASDYQTRDIHSHTHSISNIWQNSQYWKCDRFCCRFRLDTIISL